ncbi:MULTISPECIES: hypothetical protein [Clostridium]|uniref:Uncharacterized protein n=1 Tax=Clostridium frigoriphilum TaxID=443253 RepID=A0ABU7UHM1_9CLOT|nr:hypothetical protein [Clostridium sp. DSM 17811]MBU3098371.1 hypothetical protein [Clostridium sp. DSM 17811]
MKVKLLTYWKDENLECCCPLKNKCNKNHGCEELDFITDDSFNVNECMKHTSYNRVKSRMQQRR